MSRSDHDMLAAIREGREWYNANTSVVLGAVISKGAEPYAQQREIRTHGLLICTLGRRGFIRVMDKLDVLTINRINAILTAFYGNGYRLNRLNKHKDPFVTHPKTNTVSGKWGVGTTFLYLGVWWEIPGEPKLDCTILAQ